MAGAYTVKYLKPEVWSQCRQYGKDVTATTAQHYIRHRRALSLSKIEWQATYSKAAEWAVFSLYKTTAPDMTVYTSRQKTFRPDLKWRGKPLHVKSTVKHSYTDSFEDPFDSWLFQYSDTTGYGRDTELFDGRLGFVVPTLIDDSSVLVFNPIPVDAVLPLLKEPLIKKNVGRVKSLYAKDIVCLN